MRRWIFAAASFLWGTPVLAVAAGGLGLPLVPALAAGVAASGALALVTSRVLDRTVGSAMSRSTLLSLAITLTAAVAIVQFARISVFIADVNRSSFSIAPHDEFRFRHSCMSS